ncbi:MAG TPA: hypothetical protein VE890_01725 [Thermoguttaceae bacterium]|nr:hypothetical protein [Thermoguttaceae bacterium]
MTTVEDQERTEAKHRRGWWLLGFCVMFFILAVAMTIFVLRQPKQEVVEHSDMDVPLGVEEAAIIRYGGPRLVARPYRRGASMTLRIADEVEQGSMRVYDVRYVVNLPGEFDLTDYLTSSDGLPIDDLPSFRVRGLTSLTKDLETRIREIEDVGVGIWHWYYETLAGLGVFWGLWLLGLIFVGRPKRPPTPPPPPREPSIGERIEQILRAAGKSELSVEQKSQLEVLLLEYWRHRLEVGDDRMATVCRELRSSDALSHVYKTLEKWLHDPNADVGANEFLQKYREVQ